MAETALPTAFLPVFFMAAAVCVLAFIGIGLFALWRRRGAADQMMSVQLLGTGSVAVLLLLSAALAAPAILDVAIALALLAAFATAALHVGLASATRRSGGGGSA